MRFLVSTLALMFVFCYSAEGQRVKWKSFRLTEENDFL